MTPAVESAVIRAAELTSARRALAGWATRGLALLKSLGPYAAIELLLPGGSVLALLLWLYRRQRRTVPEQMVGARLESCCRASRYRIPFGKVLPENAR